MSDSVFLIAGLLFAASVLLVYDKLAKRDDFAPLALFGVRYGISAVGAVLGVLRHKPQTSFDVLTLSGPEIWIGRLSTATLLAVVVTLLLRPEKNVKLEGVALAGLAYVAAQLITSWFSPYGPQQSTFLLALFMVGCCFSARFEAADVALWTKRVMGLYLWLSLAVVAVAAPGAWEVAIDSFIPVLGFRLAGITGHPNALGPAAVMFLLLQRLSPGTGRWVGINRALAVALLLGSQSKTAIGAGLIVAAVLWWREHQESRSSVVVLAITAVLVIPLFVTSYDLRAGLVSDEELERYRTLTNRTSLWTVAVDNYLSEPVVGQGPLVFKEYARDSGLLWAAHAHNQFFQELALRGTIGLLAMLAYVLSMWRAAFRHAEKTNGVSIAIVVLLSIRLVTQVPLEDLTIEHAIVFALFVAWGREEPAIRIRRTEDLATV